MIEAEDREDSITVESFLERFEFLLDETGAPRKEQIVAVEYWFAEYGSYAETDIAAVFALTDGRWASLTSWCDTTGYGCQDGTDWVITDTLQAAVNSLDRGARVRLGLENDNEYEGLFKKPLTGNFIN
jgi:hypothetical protein